jgi:tRNA nucleotidyltransferase (CCA-adding enzyme)
MCPVCNFRRWLQRCLKSNKPVGVKAMMDKKDRERVIAEITLSHLMRLGNERGCPVSREQALAFLNQEGRAFEMWKHMMQAAEEFIAGSLFQQSFSSRGYNGFASRPRPARSVGNASL